MDLFHSTADSGEKPGYFGNTVLQKLSFHDVGTYLDRGVFFFDVV